LELELFVYYLGYWLRGGGITNKKIAIIGFVLMFVLVLPVNAQPILPNPPDLSSTPLKSGDWITYKIKFNFAGVTIQQALSNILNQTVPTSDVFQQYMNETLRKIQLIELKLTIMEKTNQTMRLNIYYYFNETINGNIDSKVSLVYPPLEDISLLFPFVRIPNDSADSIMQYINPYIDYLLGTVESSAPGLNISNWFSIKAFETTSFYCGRYRTVNKLSLDIPDCIQIAKDLATYLNNTDAWDSLPSTIRNLKFSIATYTDWDKEFGIYLGSSISVRLMGLEWFSYSALTIYASETNLWEESIIESLGFKALNFLTSYPSNLMTYAIAGIIFGDPESLKMFFIYILVLVIAIGFIGWFIKKVF